MSLLNFGGEYENIRGMYRYEFNPTKVTWKIITLCRYIAERTKVNRHISRGRNITRLDFAIDLPYRIDDIKYTYEKSVKTMQIRGRKGEIETIYLGMGSSDESIRIYDKAKEQREEGVRTRVECQVRKGFLAETFSSYNPFRALKLYQKSEQIEGLETYRDIPVVYRALIHYIEDNPDEYQNLKRHTRQEYKHYLSKFKEDNYIPVDVAGVVDRDIMARVAELKEIMGVC